MRIRYSLPGGLKGLFVDPEPDRNGIKQPQYTRGRYNVTKSEELAKFRQCVASKLAGKHFGNRLEVRNALAKAAQDCK